MQGLASGLGKAARTRWNVWWMGMTAFSLVVLATAPAFAQEKDELARRHFESGAAYFAEAEYEDALKAFKKAYELSHRHQILLNISIVEERLGHLEEAVAALDEYMLKNPSDPELETIRLRRDNLAERLEKQQKASTEEPAAEPEAVPEASSAGPEEPPVRDPVAEGAAPSRVPAYVAFGAGGLAGIGAVITGLMAQSEYDELESSCGGTCTDDETSGGKSLALTSTILTGLAVVGVGVGVVLWSSESSSEAPAPQASLRLHLGGAGAVVRF